MIKKIFLITTILILIFTISFISANYQFPGSIDVIEFYNQVETPYLEGHGLERINNNFVIDGCGEGTILDTVTNFCWIKDLKQTDKLNWDSAKNYCENLNFSGQENWQLANRDKLSSIVNYNTNICDALEKFGFINCVEDLYWVDDRSGNQAWTINFSNGEVKVRGVSSKNGRPVCFFKN